MCTQTGKSTCNSRSLVLKYYYCFLLGKKLIYCFPPSQKHPLPLRHQIAGSCCKFFQQVKRESRESRELSP